MASRTNRARAFSRLLFALVVGIDACEPGVLNPRPEDPGSQSDRGGSPFGGSTGPGSEPGTGNTKSAADAGAPDAGDSAVDARAERDAQAR